MKYVALTIGPIYKTLANAKKPKELWSGSYLFSYIMKKLIENFKDREFVTPFIKDNDIFKESEVGLFHDRFIFKSQDGDLEKLQDTIKNEIEDLAKQLNLDKEIVSKYLQIHYKEFELADGANPILEISPYLDSMELMYEVSQESDEFLKAVKSKENFLLKNKNIIDDLKKLSSNNYFCVIHADGDNMSKVIEDKDKIEEVSKGLFEYCKKSNKLIKEFGGQTIFAGGDDLLFFAPVFKGKKTVFELCDEIAKDFENRYNKKATLSFGISINFIKFPLYEALENSRTELFLKAKSRDKNAIAFNVTKHSGQSFEAIIPKADENVYNAFLSFVSSLDASQKDETSTNNFLHSIHHKIDTYKVVLKTISNDKTKLTNFFDNYFNEDEHRKYKEFFATLVDFIYAVHTSTMVQQDDKLNLVYATLRFVKFVKGDKK
jgi:CRISPR-associated protein Cmr2